MNFYLSIYNKDTDELVYENSFISYALLEEELEDWTVEKHYYQIETLETA
jgi:hypothetical protein